MDEQNKYTGGGTVRPSGAFYINRAVDHELLELCRRGRFVYLSAPKQMGKSSLLVRTARRLAEEDILSVLVDLSEIGTNLTAEQWYLGRSGFWIGY